MQSNELSTSSNSEVQIRRPSSHVVAGKFLPWIILFFSALNVIFLGGKRRAFGVFVAEFHHGDFNDTSLAELNWIADSYAALGYLTTTLSTTLILRFNRRYRLFQFAGACLILLACVSSSLATSAHVLFVTHTGLHGAGSSLILSTVGLVVNEHFDERHRYHLLATTLISGGSVASVIFVQLYAILIDQLGWRHTLLVLGGLYFIVNLTGVACFQRRTSAKTSNARLANFSARLWRMLTAEKIALLLLWTGDRMITSIVTYGMLLNLADYLHRSDASLSGSTSLTILFAAGEASTYLIGALVSALTKAYLVGKLKYILLICSLLMSLFLVLWEALANNARWSECLAFVTGFCLGPSVTFLFPAGEELTMLPAEMAYPFSLAGMGLGMLLSPTMSALIAQRFQYRWFFLVQGGLMTVKCILLAASCFLLWRYKNLFGTITSDPEDREFLLDYESEQVSMLKREKSSFQPLPITEDGQSVDNGWDHIDLMDAQEVCRTEDDRV